MYDNYHLYIIPCPGAGRVSLGLAMVDTASAVSSSPIDKILHITINLAPR